MSDFGETAKRDAIWMLCGERLSWGMSRTTYACKLLPDFVVKVEDEGTHFQNVMEWKVWQECRGTPYERWLAPCRAISDNGIFLIQARTQEPKSDQYPDRMPAFLTDFKRTNYGLLDGRLVCHDYGTSRIMRTGFTKRMQVALWWNEGER